MLRPLREAERRQYQIDQLISKEKQLNQAFKPKDFGSQSGYERSGLLNEGFDSNRDQYTSARGGSDWGDLNPSDVKATQQRIIKEQDKGLDALSEVIQRQKMMGQNIGDEVDYHNELIDDISGTVDTTERRLIQENKHVRRVTKKAGSCALIVIIVLLLIAIVVVGVVPNK